MLTRQDLSNSNPLRWGILGAAEIARKNWKAIRNSGNGIVAAVASRDIQRCQDFIARCQAEAPFDPPPQAFGAYEALLASKDVDAVYVPLPTALREEWVIRAAEAGKHVVGEKPCATSAPRLREMLDACRRNRVQFMDGVMFMHSLRLDACRRALDEEDGIGAIQRMALAFSFGAGPAFFSDNIRAHSGLEPLGCLGDLGWYCIRFALWVMKSQVPRGVRGTLISQKGRADSPRPVPTQFSGELLFEGGASAGFYCSFITELQQWAHISGTKGSLWINDFVLPRFGSEVTFETSHPVYRVEGCDFNVESNTRYHAVPEYSNSHPSAQEANLFRNFATQVRSGHLNEEWTDFALKTQRVMDACYTSSLSGEKLVPVE